MASDLVAQILAILGSKDELPSAEAFPGVPSTTVKSALDRLHSRDMVVYETLERDEANLTPEGAQIAAQGSHEAKVFEAVLKAAEGLQIDRLPVRSDTRTAVNVFVREQARFALVDIMKSRFRVSWGKRVQRWARVRLSNKVGLKKTRAF